MKSPPLKGDMRRNALAIGIIVLLTVLFLNDLKSIFIRQSVPPHQVVLLESFESVWNSSVPSPRVLIDSCVKGSRRNDWIYMHLDTNENRLILPTWEGNLLFSKLHLTSFELGTGEISWQTPIGPNQPALGSNSKNVFAVVGETDRCVPNGRDYCDTVRISAYNISSGEEEWHVHHGDMNSASMLCINEEIISIRGHATRSSIWEEVSLTTDTGEKLAFQDISPQRDHYFPNLNLDQLGLDKFDIVNNSLDGSDKFLFFLTENDNTLWAIDQTVPEIVGRVQFDGASIGEFPYFDRFAVVANDDIVAVYLGDGEQLFVFRFLPDE